MQPQENDANKMLFMHLLSMLAMSAIQQMGKLASPAAGKAEINLEAAQATIDMLDMLEAKTRGNLDADETRLLKDTLMSLKMNYVETKEQKSEVRDQRSEVGDQKAASGTETEKQTPNAESKTGQEANAGNDKTPKYHKKYE
ncbi:MAG: DUF1844 domain-containing protein [Kiritimatiellia bacterium]|jgi:hypothetical protein